MADGTSLQEMVNARHEQVKRQHRRNGIAHQWTMTNHVCRVCFGRVFCRETFEGVMIYRCSNCGVEREGKDERVICACGIKLRNGRDSGIRCVENKNQSPEFAGEIVAEQVEVPSSLKKTD